mgnify:CR=1 FL=1
MRKQRERSNKKTILKTVFLFCTLVLLVLAGFFGLKAYDKYLADKIYLVGDVMNYPDFSVDITKVSVKAVDLPIEKNIVGEYGGLDNNENCDTFSKASIVIWPGSKFQENTPSEYFKCIVRNSSRIEIKQYSKSNKQLVIDFRITAKETVDTQQIKIELIPNSGRELNKTELGGNSLIWFKQYHPYHQSDLGKDISKELIRTGYLYADVRNTEDTVDFIMSYSHDGKNSIRTMRINLTNK